MVRVQAFICMTLLFLSPFLLGISLVCKWKSGPVLAFSTTFEIIYISLKIADLIESDDERS